MALVFAILLAVLIYRLELYIFKRSWHKKLRTEISFSTDITREGETCTLTEVIENTSTLPLPSLEMKFSTASALSFVDDTNSIITDRYYRKDIFSVHGEERITRTLSFVPKKRGYYTIKSYDLLTKDYFLKHSFLLTRECDLHLYVYPRHLNVLPMDWMHRQIYGDRRTRQNLEEDPFLFRGLRDYMPGDSIRNINWKNTARHGDIVVNLYEPVQTMKAYIILDLNTALVSDKNNVREYAITVASSLINHFLNEGAPVSFYTNGKDILTKETSSPILAEDDFGIDTYDQCLSLIDAEAEVTSTKQLLDQVFKVRENNTFYLLVSSIRCRELTSILGNYRAEGIPVFGMLPYTSRDTSVIFDVKENVPSFILPWGF